jgi:LPXTG-site transpeptidase (sortase) family protein
MKTTLRRALPGAVLLAATALATTGCGSSDADPAAAPSPTAPAAVDTPSPTPVAVPRRVGRPTRLVIPAINVDEHLHPIGLKPDGAMQTPEFGEAGWYDRGPRPGAVGPAVVVAHVHGPAGDDVFAELRRLRPGDRVRVDRTDGSATFVVDAVEQVAKEHLPYRRIWTRTDRAVLRLVTCGGIPDPVTRVYPLNTIVYAHLA